MENKTLGELAKEYPNKTYKELTVIQEDARLKGEAEVAKEKEGVKKYKTKEIDYHRYWKNMYEKERKLRQEAEGETTIVKGIGMNSPEIKDSKIEIIKLKKEICELRQDNRRLAHEVEDKVNRMRKAGL